MPNFVQKNVIFGEKWHFPCKIAHISTKNQKNGWQIFRTNPQEGMKQIWSGLHYFPQILSDFSDFREIEILSKKHQIWQKKALFFPLFDLESGIFFLWSLNLIGILDFGKFGHLKANIPGFMAQKRPKNSHFLAQNGSDSRNLPGHNSRMGWNFQIP